MGIEDYIRDGYLQRVPIDKELANKEVKEAEYDLSRAENALEEEDFKWAIVKSYYSMFHAARALLFSIGLKERRHFVIAVVLEELNKQGKMGGRFVTDFSAAMSAREDADYRHVYSEDTAIIILDAAKEFLKEIKGKLKL